MEPADQSSESKTAAPERVLCPAAKEPAVKRFIIAAIFVGFGMYCYTDWGNPKYRKPESWSFKNINPVAGHLLTYYGPFVLIPAGLVVAGWAALRLRRQLLADGEGIGYAGSEKVRWEKITKLDASRLASKGVVVLHYGQDGVLKLDSYFLQNFRDLVALVERKVPADKRATT